MLGSLQQDFNFSQAPTAADDPQSVPPEHHADAQSRRPPVTSRYGLPQTRTGFLTTGKEMAAPVQLDSARQAG